MILKIFLQPTSFYFFIGGYIFSFIIVILTGKTFLHTLWISFVSGISACLFWLCCLKILSILLKPSEMAHIFKISNPDQQIDIYDDTDEDLTLSDLYSSDYSTNPNTSTESLSTNDLETITQESLTTDSNQHSILSESEGIRPSEQQYTLDSEGKFILSANGKTMRATPQEGAQAIRKTLNDSK